MGKLKILNLKKEDLKNLKILLNGLNTFNKLEIKIALEMAYEYLNKKNKSDYKFLIAKKNGDLAGFVCFGPTPLTESTYDLYWIAVSNKYQRKSFGKILLKECEERVRENGGKLLVIETSSTIKYKKARKFYEKFGYKKITEIKNFYKPKDNKLIYIKYFNGGK